MSIINGGQLIINENRHNYKISLFKVHEILIYNDF
jgi:hypothetical protein